jgi:serine/threonine protein kinase/Tol biopolymer transport system component
MQPGDHLAHYEVRAPLGKGGMGEVFLATDTKLGRDVALKVLPEDFAKDSERVARFRREAQVLASLNHPNIGAIYGLEEDNGHLFLVIELVEGEDLGKRLGRGRLPLEEAMAFAVQIAAGLEEAHERGIVHRDLKPANVMITSDDKAKILDFGLARVLQEENVESRDSSTSPTLTAAMTGAGAILGTAAYMSPEQARGKRVDRRADIWAFGAILFEMLTGGKAFTGGTATDQIASVVKSEPDWTRLPSSIPLGVRRAIAGCLQKESGRRIQHIGDARLELEGGLELPAALQPLEPAGSGLSRAGSRRWRNVGFGLLAGALIGVVAMSLVPKGQSDGGSGLPVRSFELVVEDLASSRGFVGNGIAVSPDGQDLVYLSEGNHLAHRSLVSGEGATLLAESAMQPAFSPDGSMVAFFTSWGLQKIPLRGGVAANLGPVGSYPIGTSWSDDGFIYIGRFFGESWAPVISRVPEDGGSLEQVPIPPAEDGWVSASWPHHLPGGAGLLFIRSKGMANEPAEEGTRVEVFSWGDGRSRILYEGVSWAIYSPTGHILAVTPDDRLLAIPFDTETLEVTGSPEVVATGVQYPYGLGGDGTFIYAPSHRKPMDENSLWWVDRDGSATQLDIVPDRFMDPILSPSGDRLAVIRIEPGASNIWVHDFHRRTFGPLTHGDFLITYNVWSPDGNTLAFSRGFAGTEKAGMFVVEADGSAEPHRISEGILQRLHSWTADGRAVAYSENNYTEGEPGKTGSDLWLQPVDGQGKPEVLLQTDSNELRPALSPDGRWLAYASNLSGKRELYVRPASGKGRAIQISNAGANVDGLRVVGVPGGTPSWRGDGGEIYFTQSDMMIAVPINGDTHPEVGDPVVLFQMDRNYSDSFSVTADGSRFLMLALDEGEKIGYFKVVLGFDQKLRSD